MGEPGPPGEKVSGHIIGNFRPTLRTAYVNASLPLL